MKQLYTTILTFIVLTMTTNGQTLVPYPQTGLIQGDLYYGGWTNPVFNNASIKYISDTVIASVTYSYFTNEKFSDYYTRYDNGKVYQVCRNNNGSLCGSEWLKYDFSLGLNDTFPSSDLGKLAVDSVSTMTLLNGQQRKYMKLKGVETWNNTKQYHWIDGIGDIDLGFLYPFGFEGEYGRFVCHRDSTGMVYLKTPIMWDCDSITGFNSVGIETIPLKIDFDISPTPSSDIINLKFYDMDTSDLLIQIINPIGQVVLTTRVSKITSMTSIDLTQLNNGFYFLRVSNRTIDTVKKLIKT